MLSLRYNFVRVECIDVELKIRQDNKLPTNQTWIDSPVSGAFSEHRTGPELMNSCVHEFWPSPRELMSSGRKLVNSSTRELMN